MRRVVLIFGLIAGGILAAMMLITLAFQDQVGFDKGAIIGYSTMVLAFLMVFFGLKSYRDNVNGGTITFGRALKVGLLITAIAVVCYVVTWEIIYYFLAPDFGEKYAAYAMEKVRASGGTDAQVARKAQEMAQLQQVYQNPLLNAALTLLEPLPVGLVFTLVSAGILSRKGQGAA